MCPKLWVHNRLAGAGHGVLKPFAATPLGCCHVAQGNPVSEPSRASCQLCQVVMGSFQGKFQSYPDRSFHISAVVAVITVRCHGPCERSNLDALIGCQVISYNPITTLGPRVSVTFQFLDEKNHNHSLLGWKEK